MSESSSDNPFSAGLALLAEAARLGTAQVLDATARAYGALREFERVPTRRGSAAAHLLIGQLSFFTEDLGEAREHLMAARDLFAQCGLEDGLAEARQALGQLLIRVGDYGNARVEWEAALAWASEHGEPHAVATLERQLGSLERRSGRLSEAMQHYQAAEAAFTALGDVGGLASVRLSLGNLLSAAGSGRTAKATYQAAIDLFETAGDRLGVANATRFYGDAALRCGETAEAQQSYERALVLYESLGEPLGQAAVNQSLGELAAAAGQAEACDQHLSRAIELFARMGDPLPLVGCVNTLAEFRRAQGDRTGALDVMGRGVAEARLAARWAVSAPAGRQGAEAVADLEARALAEAVALGEGAAAGEIIEAGVAGLVGVLPLLLDGPPSPVEATERLRHQVRDLVTRLRQTGPGGGAGTDSGSSAGTASGGGQEPVPGGGAGTASGGGQEPAPGGGQEPPYGSREAALGDGENPPAPTRSVPTRSAATRRAAASERTRVIAELEHLLGPRARAVIVPEPSSFFDSIDQARGRLAVAQYACPGGVVAGAPLYVVWSTPGAAPRVHGTILSAAQADRLRLLTGTRLLERSGPSEALPDPAVVAAVGQARGLGLDRSTTDPVALAAARRLAGRIHELWTALDRDRRADPTVADLAAALFPTGLVAWLTAGVDPATGLPPRLLIVPGPLLWNLPWAGLVAGPDGRRLVALARVSLAASLSSCRPESGTGRIATVAAWIPQGGTDAVHGAGVERATVGALFGQEALAATPAAFLKRLGQVDAAIASVHGQAAPGLAHGIYLAPGHCLTAADLVALDLPATLVIGACWSAWVDPTAAAEPFALPLIAHARGAQHLIGGTYPLPDAPPFPTARLLTQLYSALLGADPATALWLTQYEASEAGAAPHTWAGVVHSTTAL